MVQDKNKSTQEKAAKGLLKSSAVTGDMTFISRILGLVRDMVFARIIGTGMGAEAFYLAFKITNFLRRLFAEGAFNQAFVPVLSEYRKTKSPEEVRVLINYVAGNLGAPLLVLTLLVVAVPQLVAYPLAYGWVSDTEKFSLIVDVLRLTFPYLILICMTAFAGAILNSYDRFAVPAFTPALLNISLISSAFFLSPHLDQPAIALAWGVLIAGIAQLMFQLPFLGKLGLLPVPHLGKKHEGVERIKKLMIPALFGVSVSQINLALDAVIASFLVAGSVPWLYYSDRLVELPLGIFGIAIATVVLPSLSRFHSGKSAGDFSVTLDWAMRLVLMIAIPATAALLIIAEPILVTLFHHEEKFVTNDVIMVTKSLHAYALGLLAFMSIKILAPGFYARQDTKTPVRIGIIAMAANMVMNLLLVFVLGLGHTGLALATSLSAFLNAGLLLAGLIKQKVFVFQPGWGRFLVQLIFANAIMVLFLLYFHGDWNAWLNWSDWDRVRKLALLCLGGALTYGIGLLVTGIRLKDFAR